MPQTMTLAYSLSQAEEGWRWSVYDEDGVTVAKGADLDREAAQAAVENALRASPEPRSFLKAV